MKSKVQTVLQRVEVKRFGQLLPAPTATSRWLLLNVDRVEMLGKRTLDVQEEASGGDE